MSRFGIIIVIWIALFGATLGVRVLATGRNAGSAQRNADEERDQARQDLERKPRKNALSSMIEASQIPALEAALVGPLQENTNGLKGCRQRILDKLVRASEYFEVSFLARALGDEAPNLQKKFQVSEVVLERATVTLTQAEERCILDQFSGIQFVSSTVPSGRYVETFCFRGKNSDAKE